MIDRPAKFQSRLSVFGFSPRKNSAESSSFHHHHVSFPHNMATIGIPIKLLHESQGHIVTVELTNGQVYRGKLLEAEDNCNAQLKDVTMTARDGRVSHLENVYIRGSHVRFFVVPEMLRNAPMFRNNRALRARGAARGARGAS